MGPSLYETLLGHYKGDIDVDVLDEKTQTILSVMDNIQRILNSRAGAIKQLPDYGLPDLTLIYRELPASAHLLVYAIERTLLKYEPRLQALEITIEKSSDDMVLSYLLTCYLKEVGLVRFGTYFMPEGKAILKRWREPR